MRSSFADMAMLSPWFYVPTPNPRAKTRLFCFPYAGGSAAIFREWGKLLGPEVEVVSIQLPGRGTRFDEPPLRTITAIVTQLLGDMAALDDLPCVFFGHSNGALIAYELTKALRSRCAMTPGSLIISAKRAPQLRGLRPISFNLPQKEFVEVLREYEGTPAEVLEDPELLNFLLPTIRADFALSDLYHFEPGPKLECDMVLLGSMNDKFVPFEDLLAWKEITTGLVSHNIIGGGHFFIHSHWEDVISQVSSVLGSGDYQLNGCRKITAALS